MPKITFNNKENVFFQSVKTKVDQYFASSRIKKTGNWKLYSKTGILVSACLLDYFSLMFFSLPLAVFIVLSCLMGFLLAGIGFNVMHDACHGSYSRKDWVNDLMGLSLNVLGGNAFIWKFKHNIIHHTYTNVDGIDDDIAKSPLMRQCESQKWVPAHRFQHIYIVLVYALSSFAWVFVMDFNKYFSRRIVGAPLQKMNTQEHFIFWISKLFYLICYIIIPIMALGWKLWGIEFIFLHLTMGFTLAIIFQLAHVVEDVSFVYAGPIDHQKIENEWAIHQVCTTANFAPKNKFITWLAGGLNFQIEHHLFPRISHIHYPAISRIVKETCRQFQITYHEFPTMAQAVASHFRIMKQLGKRPQGIEAAAK
jgi:linoleoyl-CoA desaturase